MSWYWPSEGGVQVFIGSSGAERVGGAREKVWGIERFLIDSNQEQSLGELYSLIFNCDHFSAAEIFKLYWF